MLTDEYGLASVEPRPMRAALATFGAFVVAGSVPLVPFVLGLGDAFRLAAGMTLGVFFAIGAAKSLWSETPWWRSGLETLLIGGGGGGGWLTGVGSLFFGIDLLRSPACGPIPRAMTHRFTIVIRISGPAL